MYPPRALKLSPMHCPTEDSPGESLNAPRPVAHVYQVVSFGFCSRPPWWCPLPTKSLVGAWSMSWLPVTPWHLASVPRCAFFQQHQTIEVEVVEHVFTLGNGEIMPLSLCYSLSPEHPKFSFVLSLSESLIKITLYITVLKAPLSIVLNPSQKCSVCVESGQGWVGGEG